MRERKIDSPAPIPKDGLRQLEQLLKMPPAIQQQVLNQPKTTDQSAKFQVMRPIAGEKPAPVAEFTPLHPQLPVSAPVQRMTKTLADSAAMREVLRRVLSRQR